MSNRRPLQVKKVLRLAAVALLATLGANGCGDENTSTYVVGFAVTRSPENLGRLSLRVTHDAEGGFLGSGSDVACDVVANLDGASATFDDDNTRLDIDVLAPDEAITVGPEFVRCHFESSSRLRADQFSIVVRSAADGFDEPVDTDDVKVSAFIIEDPTYDDGVGGDSTVPEYDIDIAVSSATELGALQLEIVHLGSSGSWVGRGASVDCAATVDALLAANFFGGRGVKIALINLDGIPTPGTVVSCGFRTRERLSPDSFQVRIVDAADTESQAVDPLPDVVISSITER